MEQTQELTLTIDEINKLINNVYKTNPKKENTKKVSKVDKRKGTFEKLKSGNYRLSYTYNNRRYRETYSDIKSDLEAVERLKKWVKDIEDGIFNENIRVDKFCQQWIDKQVRPNCSGSKTPENDLSFLNNWFLPKFGNRTLRSITVEEIIKFFNWLKNQKTMYKDRKDNTLLSPATLEKFHSIVHSMFEVAVLWGKIEKNPCPPKKMFNFYVNSDGTPRIMQKAENTINAKIEEEIDYYSKEEYDKVIKKLEADEEEIKKNEDLTDKQKHFLYGRLLAIEIDFKTGLRRSELYGLKKEDFNIEKCVLTVTRTRQLVKKKNKKSNEILITKNLTSKRKVLLPKSLMEKIKYFIKLTPNFYDFIFEDFSIDGLSDFWIRWQKENKFRVITIRDVRHTHAGILFYLGVDIKVISQRLGHKSIRTTEKIYLVIIIELRQRVCKQIENL